MSTAGAKKTPPDRLINLNVANVKELAELPGIGPTTAKAIVQFRQKSGPFHRVEDLLAIRGISERKLKKIRPYVTIPPPPAAHPSVPVRKPAPPAALPGAANHNAANHAGATNTGGGKPAAPAASQAAPPVPTKKP